MGAGLAAHRGARGALWQDGRCLYALLAAAGCPHHGFGACRKICGGFASWTGAWATLQGVACEQAACLAADAWVDAAPGRSRKGDASFGPPVTPFPGPTLDCGLAAAGPDGSGLEGSGSGRRGGDERRGGGGGGGQPPRGDVGRDGEDGRPSDSRHGEHHYHDGKRQRRSFTDAATVTALRMALTIGAGCRGESCWRPALARAAQQRLLAGLLARSAAGLPRASAHPPAGRVRACRICQPPGAPHAHAQRVPHAGREGDARAGKHVSRRGAEHGGWCAASLAPQAPRPARVAVALQARRPCCLQLHPSCARVAADDDGLLPEWMVYHELVSTGRVHLSKASAAREAGRARAHCPAGVWRGLPR